MLDLRFIRSHPDVVRKAVSDKRSGADVDALLEADDERRRLQQEFDALRAARKALAQTAHGARPDAEQIAKGKRVKDDIAQVEERLRAVTERTNVLLSQIPNIPTGDTPIGADESANRVLRQVGAPPAFSFAPKEHWELGQRLGIVDIEHAARVSGSRFGYLLGDAVLLQFALIQFALGVLTHRDTVREIARRARLSVPDVPFVPVVPPVMIRPDVLARMARLEPAGERYFIPTDDLYLVGSAEHTLGPLHMGEALPENTLPRRYVGYSTAFRREAGSHGKDVRGILRVHQFDKLELEAFTVPEQSLAEQDFFVAIQEHLMQSLGLPYRVVLKCTGDMGDPNARAIDIEAWLPGQHAYRETHTADLMTDYQARRLRTKVRRTNGTVKYAHMNDATAFAIGRTIIAILENYQQEDGSVVIPEVLRPFLGGKDRMKAPSRGSAAPSSA